MLSGHCKIYQVSLEAQVVQGAQCSSQNLQNQTDQRLAHYQNRLLQCEQTGCRLVHRQCRRDSIRVKSSHQQTVLRSRAQALFWTGVKTCPINPNTRAPADRQDTWQKFCTSYEPPTREGRGDPRTCSSAVTHWLMHMLLSLCLPICKQLCCKTLHLCGFL